MTRAAHQPSRTFTVALRGLAVLALIALGLALALARVLWVPLEASPELPARLVGALETVAMAVAGLAGTGAGAMVARDWAARGLTSSQGDRVLDARRLELGKGAPPPDPPT